MKTKIIAFSGKKQSGKTTCANFIYGLYLSQINAFETVTVNKQGLLEIVKKDDDNVFIVDPPRYYQKLDGCDVYILNVIEQISKYIKIYSFADPLKLDICMNILGLTYDQCYGTDDQKNTETHIKWQDKYLSSREVMQFVGTDLFRKMFENVWPSSAIRKIQKDSPGIALITDCRFPNEVQAIRENGGTVVRLTRNENSSSDHISENVLNRENFDWNMFDYIIDNKDMTILEQCNAVHEIIKEIIV